jgi:hypothetical protein
MRTSDTFLVVVQEVSVANTENEMEKQGGKLAATP